MLKNDHKHSGLKQHKLILQFWSSEAWKGLPGAEIKVLAELHSFWKLQRRILSSPVAVSRDCLPSLALRHMTPNNTLIAALLCLRLSCSLSALEGSLWWHGAHLDDTQSLLHLKVLDIIISKKVPFAMWQNTSTGYGDQDTDTRGEALLCPQYLFSPPPWLRVYSPLQVYKLEFLYLQLLCRISHPKISCFVSNTLFCRLLTAHSQSSCTTLGSVPWTVKVRGPFYVI